MAGMDDYLNGSSYTGDSSEGGGQKMSLDDNGESFYGRVTGNQDEKFGDHDATKAAKQKTAAEGLADGEKSALGGNGSKITGDGTTGARQGENNILSQNATESSKSSGGFMNKVMGKRAAAKGRGYKNRGYYGRMKKWAPIIAASCGIGGFGAASFFTQLAMPFSIVAQLKENFNSIAVSQHVRTKNVYSYQADVGARKLVKNCVKAPIFGKAKFKISDRQANKFARVGIQVDRDTSPVTLKFKSESGQEFRVYPSGDYDMGENGVAIDQFYEDNQEFRDSYAAGARTWRGGIKAWFDKITNKFLSHFGVTRGVWSRFKKGQMMGTDLKNMRATVSDGANEGVMKIGSGDGNHESGATIGEDADSHQDVRVDFQEESETGSGVSIDDNAIYATDVDTDSNGGITSTDTSGTKMHMKLESFASKVAGAARVAGKFTAVASITCAVLNVVSAINLVVEAYQLTQILKTVTALFEGIQKAQVEDSTTTPVHAIGQSLLMDNTKTYNYRKTDGGAIEEETRTSNAMKSKGMQAMYGNHAIDYHDASIQSFTLSNALGWISDVLNLGKATFYTCTLAQLAASIADAITDIIELVLCIISWGVGCALDMALDVIQQIGGKLILDGVAKAIASIALPFVTNIITRKLATEIFGEDLGNAMVSGGNSYMGGAHQFAGGSLATSSSLVKYLGVKNQVDEDNARIARETLSPFDYTSKYTFAGSMVAKMIPIMTNTSTVIGSLSSIGNVFTKSISSIMPGASAAAAGITIQEAANQTKEHCNDLDSIGAVGDAFCNPYMITDTTTLDEDPGNVVNEIDDKYPEAFKGVDGDVPIINEASKLARYITYCGQRSSPFGAPDNNIANAIKSGYSTGSDVFDTVIDQIPIVGDFVGILENATLLANYGWITGKSCVTDNDGGGSETPDWEETKLYQRFIEDQRLIENMGLVEKSSVTAFLENYFEEHPVDNSYEGILARRSGLTKDQVSATIGFMEFLQWHDQYNPIGYAPYIPEEKEEDKLFIEDDYNDYAGVIALAPNLFFEERRIRNFAV